MLTYFFLVGGGGGGNGGQNFSHIAMKFSKNTCIKTNKLKMAKLLIFCKVLSFIKQFEFALTALYTLGDFKVGISVSVYCSKCTLNTGVNTNFEIAHCIHSLVCL
jgi:hypothetical protein